MQRTAQAVVHVAALGGDEQAGGSLVKAADEVRHAAFAEITREHRGKARRGGVVRLRMHGDACGLVQDEQVVILVDDVGPCRVFAVEVLARRALRERDADNIACMDNGVDMNALPV